MLTDREDPRLAKKELERTNETETRSNSTRTTTMYAVHLGIISSDFVTSSKLKRNTTVKYRESDSESDKYRDDDGK